MLSLNICDFHWPANYEQKYHFEKSRLKCNYFWSRFYRRVKLIL